MNEMFSAAARASQTMEQTVIQLAALNIRLEMLIMLTIEMLGQKDKAAATSALQAHDLMTKRIAALGQR